MFVSHDFEGQGGQGLLLGDLPDYHPFLIGMGTLHRGDIHRGREIVAYCVKEHLYPFVLQGRAAQYRDYLGTDGSLAYGLLNLRLPYGLLPEVHLHKPFHLFCHLLYHLFTHLFDEGHVLSGYVYLFIFCTQFLSFVRPGLHSYQVYTTLEILFFSKGYLYGNWFCSQLLPDLFHHLKEVGAYPVQFVYKT